MTIDEIRALKHDCEQRLGAAIDAEIDNLKTIAGIVPTGININVVSMIGPDGNGRTVPQRLVVTGVEIELKI